MVADKAPWSECVTIFVHGKLKRVKREPTVDDIPVDDFIRCNAIRSCYTGPKRMNYIRRRNKNM